MKENLAYLKHFKRLRGQGRGYSDVVGGDYENMGYLLRCLMQWAGLKPEHSVVDVGCGTGRLAYQLSQWGLKDYRGFDIVKGLLKEADRRVGNPGYQYDLVKQEKIKVRPDTTDFCCFFSVFTHIPHHNTYRYLVDALRLLKPGGRVVFSFLSYDCEFQWPMFAYMVANRAQEPITQFMADSQLKVWSERLGAKLVAHESGHLGFFPIEREVELESGVKMEGLGSIGQSVCVLEKPENWELKTDIDL